MKYSKNMSNPTRQREQELMMGALYNQLQADEIKEWYALQQANLALKNEYEQLTTLFSVLPKGTDKAITEQGMMPGDKEGMEFFFQTQWKTVVQYHKSQIHRKRLFNKPAAFTYGAKELQWYSYVATVKSICVTVPIFIILLSGYAIVKKDEPKHKVKNYYSINLSKLPLPPTEVIKLLPSIRTVTVTQVKRVSEAVPGLEELILPNTKGLPTLQEVERERTTSGAGKNIEIPKPVSTETYVETIEEEPSAYEFTPVDKGPYLDYKELYKKIIYPELAKRANIEGKVVIRVLVGKKGVPKKYLVEFSSSELLNNAAIQAVMNSTFTPAVQNNQAIDCWLSIPIVFKLR